MGYVMKGQDAFERALREALDNYEVPYNSADWAQLEKRLDNHRPPLLRPTAALYALLLGGALASFTATRALLADKDAPAIADGTGLTQVHQGSPTHVLEPSEEVVASAVEAEVVEQTKAVAPVPRATTPQRPETAPEHTSRVVDQRTGGEPPKQSTPERHDAIIRPSRTEGCPGTEITFVAQNVDKNGKHLWNFGDGSFSNKPDPVHQFAKPGTYRVMLSHSAPGGTTIQNKPVSDLIVIHDAPEAAFDHLPRAYANTVPSVHFENRSQGGKAYLWDFGDGTTSTETHPDHVYKKKGTYTVELRVTNGQGCVDRTTKQITVDSDYDLLAPKAFSPNGDGVDDLFMPEALRTLGVGFHLSIFDPNTGALVYETTDPARPWNGRINNKGELCMPGDYTWLVDMKDGAKLGGSYSGTVNLLR
jgi:gliding motility-associated-like protein